MTRSFRSFSGITTSRTEYYYYYYYYYYCYYYYYIVFIIVAIIVVVVLLFITYIINLSVVRPRSCRVIYYFDTLALGRRHQSFGRVIKNDEKQC